MNPRRPERGTKVVRGGGWMDPAQRITTTKRMHLGPEQRTAEVGFCCARRPVRNPMSSTAIHPQLVLDTHDLGSLGNSRVLLQRNATVPWFILVPDTPLGDLLDLPSG